MGSRHYSGGHINLKRFVVREIKNIVESLDFIKSGTLVGSFANGNGLDGISDIDIVIILDKLTKEKFDNVILEFRRLEKVIKTDYNYDLIINPAFGPLKFNNDKAVVLHLMIYDVEGHIKHCQKSPFACFDWQASPHYFKAPMSSVYAVTALQPNNFFNARRGIKDYIDDLRKNRISYREYSFKGSSVKQIKKYKKMSDKDRFEFAYHIMKFCMANFIKIYNNENKPYNTDKLIKMYFNVLPANKKIYSKYITKLAKMKSKNEFEKWNSRNNELLKGFLYDFEKQLHSYFNQSSSKLFFIRHQQTYMNEPEVFIGQNSNPEIIKTNYEEIKGLIRFLKMKNPSAVYSSPLKRSIQTADIIKNSLGIRQAIVDDNLLEIDYGKLDGKTFDDLKKSYPCIIKDWEKDKDPNFPGGESMQDVLKRAESFLSEITKNNIKKNHVICTHNIFLKCLLGSFFSISLNKWHKIQIPYMEPIEVINTKDGKSYINLTSEQQKAFFKDVDFGG